MKKTYLLLSILLSTLTACSSATMKKSEQTVYYTARFKPGEDFLIELKKRIEENKTTAASLVTVVGSFTQANLRFANQKNGTLIKKDLEIVSATGTLSINGSHIHLAVSDSEGKTWGGHLLEGSLVRTTAEVTWVEFKDQNFLRVPDPASGFSELVIEKK